MCRGQPKVLCVDVGLLPVHPGLWSTYVLCKGAYYFMCLRALQRDPHAAICLLMIGSTHRMKLLCAAHHVKSRAAHAASVLSSSMAAVQISMLLFAIWTKLC
jgi:hypothetical protein